MHAHIHAILLMEINVGNSLGNQCRAQHVHVDEFEGEYGMANAPTLRRGSLITFHYRWNQAVANTDKQVASRVDKDHFLYRERLFGVLSESLADSNRRKLRGWRKPKPFVMPITFEGVELVTATKPSVSDFYPGDTVYLIRIPVQYNTVETMLHTSANYDGNVGFYVGIAQVGSYPGTDSLQVRVDTLRMGT